MSELKVGDMVRIKKGPGPKVCQCQEEVGQYKKCKNCGFFNGRPMKIVELKDCGWHDCVLEGDFRTLCGNESHPTDEGLWRTEWVTEAIEKAYEWVRIK